jgi:hypothetical protein
MIAWNTELVCVYACVRHGAWTCVHLLTQHWQCNAMPAAQQHKLCQRQAGVATLLHVA